MKYLQNWENSGFYSSIEDPKIAKGIIEFKQLIATISSEADVFEAYLQQKFLPQWSCEICASLANLFKNFETLSPNLNNLRMYVESAIDLDSEDDVARKLLTIVQQLLAEKEQAFAPVMVFLARVSDGFISDLFAQEFISAYRFKIECDRKQVVYSLSVAEEKLITSFEQNGLYAWRNLNQEFWGNLKADVDGKSYGLEYLYNLLSSANRDIRKQAYEGIQTAWRSVGEIQASVLNAMNGWRIEVRKKRSTIAEQHFLDQAASDNNISRKTLNAMISAVYKRRYIGHRASAAMQKHLEIDEMMPWDLNACVPLEIEEIYSFDEAVDLIAKCFAEFNPKMGEFVIMMAKNGWIQAEVNEAASAGGYCDQFSLPREPRIFMNFMGSASNITTLAHELGHAWHYWVMRDLDEAEADYAHCVAETASLFAENLMKQFLLNQTQVYDIKLRIGWEDAASAALYLNNIPTRFEFEKSMIEHRVSGYVPEKQLCELMQQAAQKWYGNSLAEYDTYLWATIGHFSIADTSFYNFPYTFGYLFSLGIMQQREKLGSEFVTLYTNLLRDTGRMSAEDLVMKYLNRDIEDEGFWHDSLDMVDAAIRQFEGLPLKANN